MSGELPLTAAQMASVVAQLGTDGRFRYTRGQLFYALVRAGFLPAPGDAAGARAAFGVALERWECDHAPLPTLIRPETLAERASASTLPADLADYAAPRALVFEDRESLLAFVLNGFHRKIEVACVTLGFPEHVYSRLLRQVEEGIATKFYVVRHATPAGYGFADTVSKALPSGAASLEDLGLTLPWAFRLRLPLSVSAPVTVPPEVPERDRLLLERGRYAELFQAAPAELLGWVYDRISADAEEVGFG
ncbi:MAG: hypothetical protein KF718_01260 [Polyangiaceae bacterium]|nr:hypothetical protein [Polyangiaceae bacterium]